MNYRQALETFLPYMYKRASWSPTVERAMRILLRPKNRERVVLDRRAIGRAAPWVRAGCRLPAMLPSDRGPVLHERTRQLLRQLRARLRTPRSSASCPSSP